MFPNDQAAFERMHRFVSFRSGAHCAIMSVWQTTTHTSRTSSPCAQRKTGGVRQQEGAGSLDAVFAAGLISHLPHPEQGLSELARVVRPGGRLALFHPVGRAALAARHGRPLSDDDLRSEPRLAPLLARAGWRLDTYTDEDSRFLALAVRTAGASGGAPDDATRG